MQTSEGWACSAKSLGSDEGCFSLTGKSLKEFRHKSRVPRCPQEVCCNAPAPLSPPLLQFLSLSEPEKQRLDNRSPLAMAPHMTLLVTITEKLQAKLRPKATLWQSRSDNKLISDENAASPSSFITKLS